MRTLLRLSFIYLLCTLLVSLLPAQELSSAVEIPDGVERISPNAMISHLEFLVDEQEEQTIQLLLKGPKVNWQKPQSDWIEDESYAVWTRFKVTNTGTRPRSDYLVFSCCPVESRMYIVDQDTVAQEISDKENHISNLSSSFLLQLMPGETKTIYWRGRFEGAYSTTQTFVVTLSSANRILQVRSKIFSIHYLYAGLLLAMALLGLVLFGLFNDRAFLFFSLLNLGFALYFPSINYLIHGVPALLLSSNYFRLSDLAIIILVVGFSGFLINYLQLKRRSRIVLIGVLASSTFIILACLSRFVGGSKVGLISQLINISLLIWVLFLAGIIIWVNRGGAKKERILLYSVAVLFFCSLIHVVNLLIGGNVLLFQYAFQIGTLLFSGFLFFAIFNRVNSVRQEARDLLEQDRFKSRFFTNISHEFRTPLTLILGPAQQLLDRSTNDTDRELLSIIQRNANRQLELVNQILELSRLEAVKILLSPKSVDVVPLLRRLSSAYESLASYRKIELNFKTAYEELVLRVEAEKLETIVYNLLTNAFKFTPAGGAITLELGVQSDRAIIRVTDTGRGIPAEVLPQIFNRFYSTPDHLQDGTGATGVGLALTHELVKLHGGEIEVSSVPYESTVFMVKLPYQAGLISDYDPANPENIPPDTTLQSADRSETNPVPSDSAPELPLVMVVEDNTDMRSFIQGSLSAKFRVVTAADGQAGWDLIKTQLPDLVISDVMMPKMDGFQLCQAIKTEITTSHIPVILLTARSADTDRLTGLEIGADDYLTKPFSAEELIVRSHNLIRSRQLLRERFATAITLRPEEVTANSVDREFLKMAVGIVEENLENGQFSIDVLTRELGMSRSGLNRKLRALLDQSTNQFIQGIRLERAADLLRKSSQSIGEVAIQTGFSGTAYFIKCFREKYGETPGQYRKGE